MSQYLLAIDQGTTSTRAVLFDQQGKSLHQHQLNLQQFFTNDGWVEHDAEAIWQTVLETSRQVLIDSNLTAKNIAAIGITNQRETTILWDKKTGRPIYRAIVWQDRRTADVCQKLIAAGKEILIQDKTGLLLDPYFSATKISWILDHVAGAREKAECGELAFGTVECFLLWRLTGGKTHATDATNAARTLLFNIHTQEWDTELLELFHIPKTILPIVLDNCADFGVTDAEHYGHPIKIAAMAGDQQAALIGQACFQPGMIKSTYGTGGFLLLNTGDKAIKSQHRLLTTIAYRLKGKTTYAIEGSMFAAGTIMQWLGDNLHLLKTAAESESLAASVKDNGGVYLIPAFTGLGAPYWDPLARGAILGLTRDSQSAHIVRAGLEAIAYQTLDLVNAMIADGAHPLITLRVDGGMVANHWLVQFLANMLNVKIERPKIIETTALGVAYLAGLQVGIFKSLDEIATLWQSDKSFTPKLETSTRELLYQGWGKALSRVL